MNSTLNGLPMWVKAIVIVGFPIATSLFFMAQSAGILASTGAVALEFVKAHNIEAALAHQKVSEQILELTSRVTTGLRIICENGARTDEARRNCENIK